MAVHVFSYDTPVKATIMMVSMIMSCCAWDRAAIPAGNLV